jgi:hypothetical protein
LRQVGIDLKNSENFKEFLGSVKLSEKFVILRTFELLIFEDSKIDSHVKENLILEQTTITTDHKNFRIRFCEGGRN